MGTGATSSTAEAVVLARACWVAAVVTAFTVVVPFSPTAPRALAALLAVVGLVLGTVVHLARRRLTQPVAHAILAFVTAAVGLAVGSSTTPAGPGVTAYGFLWVAIHSALFHGRRAVVGHLVGVGAVLAAALVASDAPSAPQTWVFVMASVGAVATILNGKVAQLRADAARDPLTGAATRRSFLDEVDRATARAARLGEPLSLVLIDLDDFKRVNDEGGHRAGDRLLTALVAAWRRHLRRGDVVGRLGGDEFAVLLPGTDGDGARTVIAQLERASTAPWSAGVAQWSGESAEDWVARADDDLYASKGARRRT